MKNYLKKFLKRYKFVLKLYANIRLTLTKAVGIFLYVLPVKKNKVTVISYFGKGYGDSPKYIVEKLKKQDKSLDIVWLTKKPEKEDKIDGIRYVKYNFLNCMYQLATSKVWIDNCRKEYFPIKKKSQIYVQTWHGSIAFKNVEKGSESKLSPIYIKFAKNDSKMADLFVSSGKFTTNLYRRDFWYNGDILECGTPRNDIIVNQDDSITQKIKKYFNIKEEENILLYAPTFRKSGTLDAYDIDYEMLRKVLKTKFGKDFKILVRLHPNISQKANCITYDENVLNATMYPDMQELLVASDMLITDYSSSIFDFALSNKKALIYASDIEEYKKDRDFLIGYDEAPFSTATNNYELEDIINKFNYEKYLKDVQDFYNKLGVVEDGHASEKVAKYILDNMNKIKSGKKNKNITKETKTLAFNTVMLYIMQVSTFVFPLITFPYLTRVLKTENYGIYVFANAIMVYFQMLIDFGFLLSGTEECSRQRDNKEKLERITSSIVKGKLLLSCIGIIIIILCSLFTNVFDGKELYVICSYIPLVLTSFIPDYLFRGIEKMGVIASRTVAAKVIYTLIIFIFVRNKNDYYYIPLATFLSNLLIVVWSWIYIKKNLNISIVKVKLSEIKEQFKKSSTFFASRIATTAYGASNVFALSLFGFSDASMGLYGSANNLITYGRAVFSPISDSLYPYMVKNKNHKLVKKILLVLCPLIIIGCVVLYFISGFVIKIMCGEEYIEAVGLFRKMIPLLAITLPTYLFGYPMLGSINKNDKANKSVIIGAIFHIIGLLVMYVTKILTFEKVIYLTIATETIILGLRVYYFNKYKKVQVKI